MPHKINEFNPIILFEEKLIRYYSYIIIFGLEKYYVFDVLLKKYNVNVI